MLYKCSTMSRLSCFHHIRRNRNPCRIKIILRRPFVSMFRFDVCQLDFLAPEYDRARRCPRRMRCVNLFIMIEHGELLVPAR